MRILVLSDSHRDKISLMMAVKLHREADVVVFLGDGEEDFQCEKMSSLLSLKEVHSVRGNCDVYSSLPSEETFACGGKTVFILHGHTRGVKHGTEELLRAAKEKCADIVLYSHTHIPKSEYIDNMYVMCPGSIRDGSYGIVDITDNGILCYTADLSREL